MGTWRETIYYYLTKSGALAHSNILVSTQHLEYWYRVMCMIQFVNLIVDYSFEQFFPLNYDQLIDSVLLWNKTRIKLLVGRWYLSVLSIFFTVM